MKPLNEYLIEYCKSSIVELETIKQEFIKNEIYESCIYYQGKITVHENIINLIQAYDAVNSMDELQNFEDTQLP